MREKNHVVSGTVPLGRDAPPTLPAAPQAMGVAPVMPHPVVADPMARTIDLPSGGLYYDCGLAQAVVCPMRGELELSIAGTPEESPERVRAIRGAVERCCHTPGVAFRDLLLMDFAAISLHVMAVSSGTDEIGVQAGCDKPDCPLRAKRLTLTTLPCTYLRVADEDDALAHDPDDADPAILAAMAVERAMGEAADAGPEVRRIPAAKVKEPFEARIAHGAYPEVVLHWRYLRVKDVEAAEEFAIQTGAKDVSVGASLSSFLSARQVARINGEPVGAVQALQWWRRAPSPILRKWREIIEARSFGYDMRPEFSCPRGDCRKKVRVALPNDGSLFQQGRS